MVGTSLNLTLPGLSRCQLLEVEMTWGGEDGSTRQRVIAELDLAQRDGSDLTNRWQLQEMWMAARGGGIHKLVFSNSGDNYCQLQELKASLIFKSWSPHYLLEKRGVFHKFIDSDRWSHFALSISRFFINSRSCWQLRLDQFDPCMIELRDEIWP